MVIELRGRVAQTWREQMERWDAFSANLQCGERMITPVLLCGGTGSRLWPLSRKSYPKQFTKIVGEESLFQASARRLTGDGFAPPMVLTNTDYRFIVTEQLAAIGLGASATVIEPEGRDTAPAIAAAAVMLAQQDTNALMLIAPSDHVLPDVEAFHRAVELAAQSAKEGRLVTFGIRPDRPETGYGYLELTYPSGVGAVELKRFVEKPELSEAERMVADGGYLWNAGIFLFSAKAILGALETHAPDVLEAAKAAVSGAHKDLHFTRLHGEAWGTARAISIDYAVMERADNLSAVPFEGRWSDLGDWDAVWREGSGEMGVVLQGAATAVDCENVLLRSEHDGQRIVGLGLENLIAVAMPDAVLVADKSRAQDVRLIVDRLKAEEHAQADTLPRDYRPWGWFETLTLSDRFRVKRITVNPGGRLSLQSHLRRSEHWIVVDGVARVTISDKVGMLGANQSVYVPSGAKHRLENPTEKPVVLIEVQTGSYFGEDDIERFDDVYARD